MNKSLIAMFTIAVLSGCSSPQTEQADRTTPATAEKTQHPSQGVYELYFANATKFENSAQQLTQQITNKCLSAPLAAKTQWSKTMQTWMYLQGGNISVPQADALSWKVQFWPDKKDTTGRQLKSVLRTNPNIDLADLKSQSATLQGLTALEWLLYEPQLDQDRCSLATTVSVSLVDTSASYKQSLITNPWKGLNQAQWEKQYLSLVSDKLDRMSKKLSLPLANLGNPRPYFAESWRSQVSYQNLYSNLVALDELLHAENGLMTLLEPKDPRLSTLIASTLSDTIATWPKEDSLFESIQTKQGYKLALSQLNKIDQLKYLINEQAAQELGIIVGFNSTDGD